MSTGGLEYKLKFSSSSFANNAFLNYGSANYGPVVKLYVVYCYFFFRKDMLSLFS